MLIARPMWDHETGTRCNYSIWKLVPPNKVAPKNAKTATIKQAYNITGVTLPKFCWCELKKDDTSGYYLSSPLQLEIE